MLTKIQQIYLIVCLWPQLILGIIKETKHFAEILDYLTSESLVLLDIDDTLLVPNQTLGTDVWFEYRLRGNLSLGLSSSTALQKTLTEWQAVRHLSQVSLVEENIPSLIATMQERGAHLMGLTAQQYTLCTTTLSNLASLNINLAKTAPWQSDLYFINSRRMLYQQGIMFTSGTPKQQALLTFFEQTNYWPKHVLFIDDKRTHLENVEKALAKMCIPFTGLRYGYRDQAVAKFNPLIADIQWQHSTFTHLISDEEAERILANKKELLKAAAE